MPNTNERSLRSRSRALLSLVQSSVIASSFELTEGHAGHCVVKPRAALSSLPTSSTGGKHVREESMAGILDGKVALVTGGGGRNAPGTPDALAAGGAAARLPQICAPR